MSTAQPAYCRDGIYRITEVTVAVKGYSWEWSRGRRGREGRWPRRGDACSSENSGKNPSGDDISREELDNVYLMLDPQLHPIAPDTTCEESVKIFEQHKQLAQDYLKVETEIALLSRYRDQLAEKLSEAEGLQQLDQQDTEHYEVELRKLENEKEGLVQLHRNLKRQLEIIKRQQSGRRDGWVSVPPDCGGH